MGTTSMILGIIALVFTITGYGSSLALPMAIVGLILGVIGKKKNTDEDFPAGKAVAGIIMNGILVVLSLLVLICVCVVCGSCLAAGGVGSCAEMASYSSYY